MEIDLLFIGIYLTLFQVLHGLHIPLTEQFNSEITAVNFISLPHNARTRRDSATHQVPEKSVLHLAVSGAHQHIVLEKNPNIDVSNIPVFKTNNGRIERIHLDFDKEHVLYQAPAVGGSFLVTCHKNKSSTYREVFGSFHHNSSLYIIQPADVNGGVKGDGHVVSRVPDQTLVFEGVSPKDLPAPASIPEETDGNHGNKRTKRQSGPYNIELLSVVDYKSYKFWYDMTSGSDRSSDATGLVMQYIAYIINSVDMRYKTVTGVNRVLNVLSAGIYIADTAASSPWAENNNVNGQVSSGSTLDSFRDWVVDQSGLPQNDHAMGFTGYDIVSSGTGDSSGIAFTSVLCTADSTSLVEDSFNFITMSTVAHELGHSLGASHDGIGNSCQGSDNYIMASVNSVVNDPSIGQNTWKFSPCTGQEFQTYINILDRRGDNCMLSTASSSYIPATPKPMAEAYPADQTCVYKYGVGSYVCRSIQSYDTICTSMFCNKPGTSNCFSTIPAEGTPCGQGKWCQQGRCVTSSRAPSNNADNCALGDRPGLFDDTGSTCAQHIAKNKAACYGDYTGSNCCGSCNAVRTGDASCEFGDHGPDFCSTMPRFGCYNNEQFCCATCKPLKNNALPGCEFGDRFSGCQRANCDRYSAENLAGCCETCYDPAKTVSTTTSTSTTKTTPTTTTTTTTPTTTSTTTTTPTTTKRTPTTTSTTTTTTTTTPTTKTTKPPVTTKSTSSSTSLPESTTKVTKTTKTSSTDTESTERPVEEPASDLIFIIAGCLAGAIVVIVFVVILCICLRRRRAKNAGTSGGRKPSKDNAYDNIGFVTSASEKPHHPPPRRNNSNTTFANNFSNGSANGSTHVPISTISNGSSEHVDGYMRPASVQLTLPPAETVHYTAPNKPKFKPLVPPNKPKKKAFIAPRPSPDLSKRASKPVHYKRASGLSNSSTDTIDRASSSHNSGSIAETNVIPVLDEYDSIGEIQKVPQTSRPTLPDNHPSSLRDFGRLKVDLANEINKKTADKLVDNTAGVHEKKPKDKFKNISDDEKRKALPSIPLPSIPPRPLPRVKSRKRSEEIAKLPSEKLDKKEPEHFNNGYEEVDNVQRLDDVIPPRKPPIKPVPRRQISTGSSETEKPEVPLKQALRPPLKIVPRRRRGSGNTAESRTSLTIDNEQVEIQI